VRILEGVNAVGVDLVDFSSALSTMCVNAVTPQNFEKQPRELRGCFLIR
jgi:hypothetical protein